MASSRTRRRPRPSRAWVPWVAAPAVAALVAAGYYGVRAYEQRHGEVRFEAPDGAAPSLELTFVPDQLAFASPSPPPALGARTVDAGAFSFDRALCPERSVVRYQGEGIGAGFAYVELGKPPKTVTLRPPAQLRGRVGEPISYWCMGWRCAGYRPVAGAEVVVMGGGEHGVDLARAVTDERGEFTVSGFDGELDALGLRIRAAGFEVVHQHLSGLDEHAADRALVALSRAPARSGRVVVAPELDLAARDLLLLARGLPGVQARPDDDGEVRLDHIPPDVEARVIVYGLPPTAAQSDARTSRDGEFEVRVVPGAIVRGRVLGQELEPVPDALVWVGSGQPTRTDRDGCFELTHVLPGEQKITAQWRPRKRRSKPWLTSRQLSLQGGETYERVELLLDR